MKNYKKTIKLIVLIVAMLTFSCKNEIKQKNQINTDTVDSKLNQEHKSSISILNNILDKNLITIINQNNEFKLSSSKKYNKVILSKKSLYLEIVEPINYEVERIEELGIGFKVYFKDENFYYDVSLVDKKKDIYYWKNLSLSNNEIDNEYSFYTVEENKLSVINLNREDSQNIQILSDQSTWKIKCDNSNAYYFKYSKENNEGSLSGILKKDYAFSITGDVTKKTDLYEFTYTENYSISSESESEQFWNDFSTKEKIAEIKVLNEHQIRFKWYGFYNDKIKKREFIKNPFIYDGSEDTIILEKCE